MSSQPLPDPFRAIQLVWAALLGGILIWGGVAWALSAGHLGEPFAAALDPGLVRPLLLIPLSLLGVGVVLRRSGVEIPGDPDPVGAYRLKIVLVSAIQEGGGLLAVALCLLAGLTSWIPAVAALAAFAMVLTRPRREDLEG